MIKRFNKNTNLNPDLDSRRSKYFLVSIDFRDARVAG